MNPLDTITLTGLRATAFHGLLEHERREGQEFVVDVTVHLNLLDTADDISKTIHYGELAEEVVAAMQSDPVDLIETLAERIAEVVLAHEAAIVVNVTVHKPSAPIAVPFDDVSVAIMRGRPERMEPAGFALDPREQR